MEQAKSSSSEHAIAGATIAAFLLTTLFRQHLLVLLFGVPAVVTGEYFVRSATHYFLGDLLIRATPAFVIIVGTINSTFRCSLLRRIRCVQVGKILATVLTVICVAWLLNAVGAWRFAWRHSEDSGVPIAYMSMVGRQTVGLIVWGFTMIVVTPFVEETIFRNWLLRLAAFCTKSETLAVVITSAAFGLGHVGAWLLGEAGDRQLIHAAWLSLASLLLARSTIRSGGCYAPALIAHTTYNALHYSTLLYSASTIVGNS